MKDRLLTDVDIGKTLARAKEEYWTHKPHPLFEVEKELLTAQDVQTLRLIIEELVKRMVAVKNPKVITNERCTLIANASWEEAKQALIKTVREFGEER